MVNEALAISYDGRHIAAYFAALWPRYHKSLNFIGYPAGAGFRLTSTTPISTSAAPVSWSGVRISSSPT